MIERISKPARASACGPCVVGVCLLAHTSCAARRVQYPPGEVQIESLRTMSLAELGDVKVTTASKEPEEVWHTPAPTFVLTSEGIQRSGATSIPELLRLVPGVQVSRMQSDQWALPAQQAPAYQTADAHLAWQISRHIRISADGRSLLQPYHREFSDHNGNLVGIRRSIYGGIQWVP